MKYQNWDQYTKHLENSFPNNLSNIYFIITKDDYERQKLINLTLSYLPKKNFLSIEKYSSNTHSVNDFLKNIDSLNLFNDTTIQILNDIDNFKTKDLTTLVSFFKTQKLNGHVILTANDKKSLLSLFSIINDKGVIIDLSSEKPWEKEKRLIHFIKKKCAQAKKNIDQESIDFIIKFTNLDMSLIEKEIEKTALFAGDKTNIEKEDIQKICVFNSNYSTWQIAEKIIFSKDLIKTQLEKDLILNSETFFSLIIAFRYFLQEGLKISSALENKLDINKLFPKIKYNVLQKKALFAKNMTSNYFSYGLKLLFEIENLSKNGFTKYYALIDNFRYKLASQLPLS